MRKIPPRTGLLFLAVWCFVVAGGGWLYVWYRRPAAATLPFFGRLLAGGLVVVLPAAGLLLCLFFGNLWLLNAPGRAVSHGRFARGLALYERAAQRFHRRPLLVPPFLVGRINALVFLGRFADAEQALATLPVEVWDGPYGHACRLLKALLLTWHTGDDRAALAVVADAVRRLPPKLPPHEFLYLQAYLLDRASQGAAADPVYAAAEAAAAAWMQQRRTWAARLLGAPDARRVTDLQCLYYRAFHARARGASGPAEAARQRLAACPFANCYGTQCDRLWPRTQAPGA